MTSPSLFSARLYRLWQATLCRYADCPEGHRVAKDDQGVTCKTRREWMGIPND